MTDPTAVALGMDVAGMLRYQIGVIDREDRLESGTGNWKETFREDAGGTLSRCAGICSANHPSGIEPRVLLDSRSTP